METKVCTTCKESKPVERYSPMKNGKYGVRSKCKECCVNYSKERRRSPEIKKRHAELEKIRRDKRNKLDPLYYKKRWLKIGEGANEYRRNKYANDLIYADLQREKARSRKFTEAYRLRLQSPITKEKNKERSKNRRLDPHVKNEINAYSKKYRVELREAYIEGILVHSHGIPKEKITNELKQEYKEVIQLKRELKNEQLRHKT